MVWNAGNGPFNTEHDQSRESGCVRTLLYTYVYSTFCMRSLVDAHFSFVARVLCVVSRVHYVL